MGRLGERQRRPGAHVRLLHEHVAAPHQARTPPASFFFSPRTVPDSALVQLPSPTCLKPQQRRKYTPDRARNTYAYSSYTYDIRVTCIGARCGAGGTLHCRKGAWWCVVCHGWEVVPGLSSKSRTGPNSKAETEENGPRRVEPIGRFLGAGSLEMSELLSSPHPPSGAGGLLLAVFVQGCCSAVAPRHRHCNYHEQGA